MKNPLTPDARPPARWLDVVILFGAILLLTWHPFFLHGEIKVFEMGLYLPGIDAVLNGAVPYRDFFHLRGPLELYIPAWLMAWGGVQFSWLCFYFYAGTVATFLSAVFLAREIFQTRLMLYLMTPVLIARTFPRIFYRDWGGLRYAWGLLSVGCAARFFRTGQMRWAFWSGILAAGGLLTSVEIGLFAILGMGAATVWAWFLGPQPRRDLLRGAGGMALGVAVVLLPYGIYLSAVGGLGPFVNAMHTVVSQMCVVFDQHAIDPAPRNIVEAAGAMLHFTGKNFRHMTPAYLYLILLGYMLFRAHRRILTRRDTAVVAVGCYGFILYNTAFRTIWGPQFEMALQPEKVLYFLLAERGYIFLRAWRPEGMPGPAVFWQRMKRWGVPAVIVLLVIASLGYAFSRIGKRFWVGQAAGALLSGQPLPTGDSSWRPVRTPRTQGIVAPSDVADELEALVPALAALTHEGEPVFMFPDIGAYSFYANRPFVGRFPMVNLSWFSQDWHEELLQNLKSHPPRCVVMPRELSELSQKSYFTLEANRKKYADVMSWVEKNYRVVQTTPMSKIYLHREADDARP